MNNRQEWSEGDLSFSAEDMNYGFDRGVAVEFRKDGGWKRHAVYVKDGFTQDDAVKYLRGWSERMKAEDK